MLRLVLLLLYLIASSFSTVPQTKQGGTTDPLVLNPPTSPPQADGGGGIDPLG